VPNPMSRLASTIRNRRAAVDHDTDERDEDDIELLLFRDTTGYRVATVVMFVVLVITTIASLLLR
jgi:hypothetical protein